MLPSFVFSEKIQFSGLEKGNEFVPTGTSKSPEKPLEKGLFGATIIPPSPLSDADLFKIQRKIMNLNLNDHLISERVLGKETFHESEIIKITVVSEKDQETLIEAIRADEKFAGCFVSPLICKKTHRLYSFPWKQGTTLSSFIDLLKKQQELGNGICGMNFRYKSLKKDDPSSLCKMM